MRLSDLYRAVKTGYAPDLRTMGYARILRNAAASVIKTISGALPLSFTAKGMPLLDYTLYGDAVQGGTPAPDAPVEVVGCGDYDAGAGFYKIPVSVQSEDGTESTTAIYLGKPLYKIGEYSDCIDYSEGVVKRKIRELVLTGDEQWKQNTVVNINIIRVALTLSYKATSYNDGECTHYQYEYKNAEGLCFVGSDCRTLYFIDSTRAPDVETWKSYLAEQYAAGTPVKVYYVLAEPETESIDLPQIPTCNGMTTIDTSTAVKPSGVEIKYR